MQFRSLVHHSLQWCCHALGSGLHRPIARRPIHSRFPQSNGTRTMAIFPVPPVAPSASPLLRLPVPTLVRCRVPLPFSSAPFPCTGAARRTPRALRPPQGFHGLLNHVPVYPRCRSSYEYGTTVASICLLSRRRFAFPSPADFVFLVVTHFFPCPDRRLPVRHRYEAAYQPRPSESRPGRIPPSESRPRPNTSSQVLPGRARVSLVGTCSRCAEGA